MRILNSHCQRRRGLSLVELAVVVMIVGIVASVATPMYFYALSRGRVDAAARKLLADLAMVQSAAQVSSSNRTVTFSTVDGSYVANGFPDFDRPLSEFQVRLGSAPFWVSMISVEMGDDQILVFDGFGRPDSDGTIVLQSGNLQRVVTIDPLTGEGTAQ